MTGEPTLPIKHPAHVMSQTVLTGEDWLSDRDRKAQARAVAARRKAALACAAKLEAAADALTAYLAACRECDDGSDDRQRGLADGRHKLISDCMEYSGWLESVYGGDR